MFFVSLLKGIEDNGYSFSILVCRIQKVNNLADCSVLDNKHVFCKAFEQAENASFGIELGVSIGFLWDGFERFNDSTNFEVVIAFGAVKGSDYKVDDIQMVMICLNKKGMYLFLCFGHLCSFLFLSL